jgi:hypothetical protein
MMTDIVYYMNPQCDGEDLIGVGMVKKRKGPFAVTLVDVFSEEEFDASLFLIEPITPLGRLLQNARVLWVKIFGNEAAQTLLSQVEMHKQSFFEYLKVRNDYHNQI